MQLRFELLSDNFAIVRRPAAAAVPEWAGGAYFSAIIRAVGEVSIVCPERVVPPTETVSTGWRVIRLVGPFDLDLTGVLVTVLAPLAEARVPIFAISTYDTDYVLVPEAALQAARAALRTAGHHEVASR